MDSPNDDLYKVVPSPSFLVSGVMENQVLLFLRSVQHGAIILSGFTCAYFSYWHANLKDPVPLGLNAFLIVVSALFYVFPDCMMTDHLSVLSRSSKTTSSLRYPLPSATIDPATELF